MDFKKKLKTRLYLAVSYIVLGVILIAGAMTMKTDNQFISSFGLALVVIGIVRVRNYRMITRDEQTIRRQAIAESDERNLSIINRARSATFCIYVFCSGIAVIVLSFLNLYEAAKWISYSIMLMVLIYWISYLVIRQRS